MISADEKTRVLVVDDDPSMVATLRDVLEAGGFSVDAAHSGSEALERTRETSPDCVLMDMRMPGLDGVATFRELKRSSPDCNVIFMTAYASSDLVDEARNEGAVEVVPKPLDLERVIHLIEETTQRLPVLVVGDERTSLTTLGHSLSAPELDVRFVRNVEEAVLAFDEHPWRAVVVDMEYGIRIGVEGLRVVRDLDPQASMLLASAADELNPETRREMEEIATTYFSRPFSVEDVVGRLRRVSQRRKLNRPVDPS